MSINILVIVRVVNCLQEKPKEKAAVGRVSWPLFGFDGMAVASATLRLSPARDGRPVEKLGLSAASVINRKFINVEALRVYGFCRDTPSESVMILGN